VQYASITVGQVDSYVVILNALLEYSDYNQGIGCLEELLDVKSIVVLQMKDYLRSRNINNSEGIVCEAVSEKDIVFKQVRWIRILFGKNLLMGENFFAAASLKLDKVVSRSRCDQDSPGRVWI
jgi:hypothetical protein